RDYKVTGVQTCALPIFERRFERVRIDARALYFGVVWQGFQKTDGAFGALDRHLRPKRRRVGVFAAQIVDALPNESRRPVQTAQEIACQVVCRTNGEDIDGIDR